MLILHFLVGHLIGVPKVTNHFGVLLSVGCCTTPGAFVFTHLQVQLSVLCSVVHLLMQFIIVAQNGNLANFLHGSQFLNALVGFVACLLLASHPSACWLLGAVIVFFCCSSYELASH